MPGWDRLGLYRGPDGLQKSLKCEKHEKDQQKTLK